MRNYFEGILPKPVDDLYRLFIKERNPRRLSRAAFPLLEELEKYSDTSRYVPSLREMLIVRIIDAVCRILFFLLILFSSLSLFSSVQYISPALSFSSVPISTSVFHLNSSQLLLASLVCVSNFFSSA